MSKLNKLAPYVKCPATRVLEQIEFCIVECEYFVGKVGENVQCTFEEK